MGWKQTTIGLLSDALRFVIKSFLLIDAILIALFSLWFVAQFFWHLRGFLARTMFGAEW